MKEESMTGCCAETYSPEIEDLLDAMFIAGARALGLAVHERISTDAVEKILLAASSMAERLNTLLTLLNGAEGESEIGN